MMLTSVELLPRVEGLVVVSVKLELKFGTV